MQIGALEIELFANIARLQRDMNRANQVVDRAASGMARAAEMAKSALAGIAGGFSVGAIVSQLVSAQREFDKLNSSLVTATGSVQGASAAYKSLQAFASTTPYSVAEATEAFIKMKNLGLDPSERALRSYGNTASAMGKDLDQMIEAVADAASGEFERLKEFGIKASQENGKVALTFRGVTTTIGNNAAAIQAYLKKIGEVEFAGAMERRAKTLDGAISGLGDSWDSFVLKFAQSGFGDAAQDGVRKLGELLERLGDRVDSVADGMVAAAKIGGAYVGAFILAPALFQATATALGNLNLQIALARMEMATGTPIAGLFATSVERVGVAALWSSGMLGKLKIATGLLFAGFAGWEIGKYLEEQFVEVKVFAEVLTGAVLEMWEHIKLASKLALDAMTAMWRVTFSGLALSLAPMYEGIAAGLRKIGFDEKAGQIEEFAGRVRAAGNAQGTFASRTAEARAEHERNIKAIRQVTDSHVAAIIVADQVSEATRGTAVAAAEAGKATQELSKEQKQALKAAADFIESQEKELEAIGKTEAQKRMLAAARAAAAAPEAAQKKRIIELAEAINSESESWALAEKAREAAAKQDSDHYDKLRASTVAIEDRVAQMRSEIDLYGLSASVAVDAEKAKLEAKLALGPATHAELIALDQQIEKLGQLADLVRKKEVLDASKKAADQVIEDQKRLWGDIERTAHDTFISIFDSGKSAFDRLKDALKNGLYELLYQMTIKKWIINLSAQTNGAGGISQIGSMLGGSQGAGIGGMFSNASSLLSMGKTIYSGFTGGIASTLGGWASSAGSMFGSSAVSSFGSGLSASVAGSGDAAMAAWASNTGNLAGGASAGMSAGTYAIPIAGWVAAGMALSNSLYKQGWDTHNGTVKDPLQLGGGIRLFDNILRGIGLSNTAANIFSGQATFARLFGRKNPEIESQGIQGTFGGAGFSGEAYANILEKGGVFRSDKRYVKTGALSADQDASFDATYKALVDAAKGFASTLGIETGVIDGYNKQIKLQLGTDEAKNQEAIAKLFGEIGDELSLRLVPNLAGFAQAGEATSATLQRLVTDYATVDEALTAIGMQFGALGVQSLEARERLLVAAGGLEAFAGNTAGFQQNFLTEAERNAPVLKAVTEQLAALGLAGVDTRDEFKQVVLGLDLTTDAGAKQYGVLMKMQEAFAQVYPAIDKAAIAAAELAKAEERANQVREERRGLQDQLDELTMSELQLLEKRRAAVDESNRPLFDQIEAAKAAKLALEAQAEAQRAATQAAEEARVAAVQAAKDRGSALLAGVDSMFSALQSAVTREKSLLQDSATAHRALSSALRGTLDGMRAVGDDQADRMDAQAQIRAALAIARAGGALPDADSLKGALSAVSKDASSMFATQQDYLRDFYATQNDIADLAGLTDKSLSAEEQQLQKLDGILASAQQQIDALKGLGVTGLTLVDMVRGFDLAISAAKADPVASSGGALADLYKQVLGRAADSAGLSYWQDQVAAGMSLEQVRQFMQQSDEYKRYSKVPGFAGGGDHTGGIRLVGELGPEVEATGPSRIHSTRDLMASLRAPSDNSAVLAAAVERLTATTEAQARTIDRLEAAMDQTERNTKRVADGLEILSNGYDAIRTKEQSA